MSRIVSKTITAENQFSDPKRLTGHFNLSISGTFVATITVQRSFDGVTWNDVDTFTAPTEEVGFDADVMFYRAGVKTGQFTSGSVSISIIGNFKWER